MTFKALENLLFPGSTLSVCYLAVCAIVDDLKATMSLSKLSLQTDVLLPLQISDAKPNSVHHFLKPGHLTIIGTVCRI